MTKVVIPSMTDGQIDKAVEQITSKFRKELRNHRDELPSNAVQTVLGQKDFFPTLYAEFRTRVEAICGTIVEVDRSVRPVYPDWVDKVIHPELESTGPDTFDILKDVSLWLHDKQKNAGVTTGKVIYDYLKKNNILESCGSLQDALAIQKLGVAAFKKAFGNKVVYFWKSVVRDRRDGYLVVPYLRYLCVCGGRVVLRWLWLDGGWYGGNPAVRFTSPPATPSA